MRRIPRSLVSYADADQARRRWLPAKWLAAMLITAAVALLAPDATYVTAGRSGTTAAGCRGVTQELLPANGFITNPSRAQGGHLWWHRSADGSVCIGTVIMWAQYNTTAAKTWRVIVYSARHPGGLTVASRALTIKRGWYWRGFGVHQAYRGLSAVCVTATESFGTSCVHFSGPAG
ncbi:MAG TPA: hypothetical protein VHS30_20660 [Streptosporangiaceae bacterium]|nr:hypothetical protein [Streptosporangiaceae bacterium]